MAKVPPGVGPRFPQVLVLVGATGDLSRRKLLPGLFHLCSAGFIPACRIIGVSLDAIDVDAFRAIARGAIDQFAGRKVNVYVNDSSTPALVVTELSDRRGDFKLTLADGADGLTEVKIVRNGIEDIVKPLKSPALATAALSLSWRSLLK